HAARGLFGREAGADGETAAQRLRDRHDVGRDARVFMREELAGPADARLHLVEHEQNALLVAERTDAPRSSFGITRMPPSPWIGSMRMPAVAGPIAASSAFRSPKGTCGKPGIAGPKPSRYFFWPPAAMVASVR